MTTEIGAYDAKTRLPELLRQVKAGKRFTITNRGEAIADLIPSERGSAEDARLAIEKFQAYIGANPVQLPPGTSVRELMEEGRA